MNRFKIALGREEDFMEVWRKRETYLDEVPGFVEFNLLKGKTTDEFTLFASHSKWESRTLFEDWTKSDSFKKSHASSGSASGIYLGHPEFEGFDVVL